MPHIMFLACLFVISLVFWLCVFVVLENLESDHEAFRFKSVKSGINGLPEPGAGGSGAICNKSTCIMKSMEVMKCTVIRIVLRFIYEILCAIENMFGMVLMGLCACDKAPMAESYLGQDKMTCSNKSSIPGVICLTPLAVYMAFFGIVFGVWKAIFLFSNLCLVPLGPPLYTSP